jgi:hypothetical protein
MASEISIIASRLTLGLPLLAHLFLGRYAHVVSYCLAVPLDIP